MASGWANDDAVNEQINSTIEDAVARARGEIPRGESLRNAKSAENRFRRRGEKPFPAYGYALPASRIKIQKMLHIQDIIAEVRKTASYVDFPLPKLTAQALPLRSRFLANA
jgi:hypothetical protein